MMSYKINYSNDTKTSLTILPNSIDDSLPLIFYGYNHSNYGEGLWTNLLHLLENYASDGSTLLNPVEGMLWYNNSEKVLNIFKATGWSEIFDLEKYEEQYGSDIYGLISKITDALKKSPPSDNIKKLIDELSKLFVPLTGGTLTGNLYLPSEKYANYKTLPNYTQKVVTAGFLEWFTDDFMTHYEKPLSAGFDDGGFGTGFDDGTINAGNIGDFLPIKTEESTTITGENLNISSEVYFKKATVPTTVNANCAINKEYADSLVTESSLWDKIKDTTEFKKAIDNIATSANTTESSSSESTAYTNIGEVGSYMSIYALCEKSGTSSTSLYTTPLSINITPLSVNSKFYINVSLLLSNGTTPGASICGLYKNGNALIEKFSAIDRGTDSDMIASCTTFIDAVTDITPVTYDIRIYNELATGKWYTNQSADGTTSGMSYMTILEYQDTNFVSSEFSDFVPSNDVTSSTTLPTTTTTAQQITSSTTLLPGNTSTTTTGKPTSTTTLKPTTTTTLKPTTTTTLKPTTTTTVAYVSKVVEYKIPNPTAEYYEYTVPDGITKISVDIVGAGGGAGGYGGGSKVGGNGGHGVKMSATITVTPNEILRIYVGCGGVGGGTSNKDFKTTQKSIFRNPNDSILPVIVNKKSLADSGVFTGTGETNSNWVSFLSRNNFWTSSLGNKIDNNTFNVTFPRTTSYIVSSSIDNYGSIKLDSVLVVDVPGYKNVFSKCTTLSKGSHAITVYGYNSSGPRGMALDIRETSSGFNNGGVGGTSGPNGFSGEGGYGGGSSAIVKSDGTVLLVAAGGGGGGGADMKGIPTGLIINGIPKSTTDTYSDTGNGATPGANVDGAGGGGGGGGYASDGKGIGLGGKITAVNADSNTYGEGGREGKSYINTDFVTVTQTMYPSANGTPGYGGIAKTSATQVAATVGINEDGQCGYLKIATLKP